MRQRLSCQSGVACAAFMRQNRRQMAADASEFEASRALPQEVRHTRGMMPLPRLLEPGPGLTATLARFNTGSLPDVVKALRQ